MTTTLVPGAVVIEPVAAATPVDKDFLSHFGAFPENVWLIHVVDDKYACNSVTTPGPDPMAVNGLAVFLNKAETDVYLSTFGSIPGTTPKAVQSTYEAARKMAKDKHLDCLILWKDGIMSDLNFVN